VRLGEAWIRGRRRRLSKSHLDRNGRAARALFPHLKLLPIAEYPCGDSWGYQPLGGKTLMDRQAKPLSVGGPRVAVARFAFSSDKPGLDYLARGMQGELVGILAQFDWLTVFPILTDQPVDKAFSDMMERIDYLVRNTMQAANDAKGLTLKATKRRGKGSHTLDEIGDKATMVPLP
jgi:hypothetical protein